MKGVGAPVGAAPPARPRAGSRRFRWAVLAAFALGCAASPAASPPVQAPSAPSAPAAAAPPPARALPGLANQLEVGEAEPLAPSPAAKATPGWLGVALTRPEGGEAGVRVTRVLRGSPAAMQGLIAGDLVVSLNDVPTHDPAALSSLIAALGPGGRANLAVRRDGEYRLLAVGLGENPGFEGQLRLGYVGEKAPELDGLKVARGTLEPRLASLEGKVVVLEFWATWCVACRALMPTLNGWHQRYRAEGATVVSVTMDPVDKAASDAAELGLEYPVLSDTEGTAVRGYQAFALPTLFVIDRLGVVRDVAVGYDVERLRELREVIERLLAES